MLKKNWLSESFLLPETIWITGSLAVMFFLIFSIYLHLDSILSLSTAFGSMTAIVINAHRIWLEGQRKQQKKDQC
jgi:hypothetical protein